MSNNFINTAGVFKGFDGFICSSAMIHIFKMCIFSWPAPNMTLFLTCPILTVFKVIMTTPSHCTRDNFILCTFRLECSCRDAESTSYHYQDGTLCVYIYIYIHITTNSPSGGIPGKLGRFPKLWSIITGNIHGTIPSCVVTCSSQMLTANILVIITTHLDICGSSWRSK